MTTEKILTACYAVANQMDDENKNAFKIAIDKNIKLSECSPSVGACLAELVKELKTDITTQIAKNNGTVKILKLIKSILKTAPENRPMLKYTYIENGFQFACDGYRAVKLSSIIDTLPLLPDNLEKIDVSKFFAIAEKNTRQLTPPDITTLKTTIIEQKANKNKTIVFDFGEGLPMVNAQWLLEFMEAFPDAEFFAGDNSPESCSIYINSSKGNGLLLPISKRR